MHTARSQSIPLNLILQTTNKRAYASYAYNK